MSYMPMTIGSRSELTNFVIYPMYVYVRNVMKLLTIVLIEMESDRTEWHYDISMEIFL